MHKDYRIQCQSSEYTTMHSIAIVGLFLYVFGVPAFYFLQLRRVRDQLFDEVPPLTRTDGAFRSEADGKWYKVNSASFEKYGFLYGAYEPYWYWWETLELIKKAFFTGLLILVIPGSPSQILIAMCAGIGLIVG